MPYTLLMTAVLVVSFVSMFYLVNFCESIIYRREFRAASADDPASAGKA